MIIAIVGSVALEGNQEAYKLINCIERNLMCSKVISGGARGIDSMAIEVAKKLGLDYEEYKPKEQRWLRGSPDGFWFRNLKIAEMCDHLVRIVADNSQTYGSGWTRDQAKRFGKTTEEHIIHIP